MRKNPVMLILTIVFLLFLSSCANRAPNYLEYQSHSFTAKGSLTYDGSVCEITVNLKEKNSPDSIYYRDGSINFTSPNELAGVTVEFSNDGTFISSGDVKIPIHVSSLDTPNIISSLFSFEQSDICSVNTQKNDEGPIDVIEVKKELISGKIHIDHESFMPTKIIANIDSANIIFDISSIEITDMEGNND